MVTLSPESERGRLQAGGLDVERSRVLADRVADKKCIWIHTTGSIINSRRAGARSGSCLVSRKESITSLQNSFFASCDARFRSEKIQTKYASKTTTVIATAIRGLAIGRQTRGRTGARFRALRTLHHGHDGVSIFETAVAGHFRPKVQLVRRTGVHIHLDAEGRALVGGQRQASPGQIGPGLRRSAALGPRRRRSENRAAGQRDLGVTERRGGWW